jgi:hypothetical protein
MRLLRWRVGGSLCPSVVFLTEYFLLPGIFLLPHPPAPYPPSGQGELGADSRFGVPASATLLRAWRFAPLAPTAGSRSYLFIRRKATKSAVRLGSPFVPAGAKGAGEIGRGTTKAPQGKTQASDQTPAYTAKSAKLCSNLKNPLRCKRRQPQT